MREGASPLDFTLCARDEGGRLRALPRQDLLLFTPLNPEVGSPYGVSLLRSMPFLTEILLKIYYAEMCIRDRYQPWYQGRHEQVHDGDGKSGQGRLLASVPL